MKKLGDSKQSVDRAMVEASGLLALGDAPPVSSSFKVKGHDRVTLGHDVGRKETALGVGPVESVVPGYG